jgi:hypothetical protein
MPFPVDKKFIIETEAKLGMQFPQAYRVRMLRDNGGELSINGDGWQLHPFFDTSDRKRIARTCNDITRETKEAREWRGFPANAVAIGTNGTGDRLVFLPEPDSSILQDHPFIWLHETGELVPASISFEEDHP